MNQEKGIQVSKKAGLKLDIDIIFILALEPSFSQGISTLTHSEELYNSN